MEFAKPSIIAKESSRKVRVPVNRINGADGHVSVKWVTKNITAIDGKDYKGGEGVLVFDNGEINRTIDIPLYDSNVSRYIKFHFNILILINLKNCIVSRYF